MDKRLERIDRSYTKFLNDLNTQQISSHYNISNEIQINITRIKEDIFTVYITYENIPPLIAQLNLPCDINNYIKSFLHKQDKIYASLVFPTQYPFRPPIWSIEYAIKDLKKEIAIFNRSLDDAWIPCINFENEILCYLVWAIQMI